MTELMACGMMNLRVGNLGLFLNKVGYCLLTQVLRAQSKAITALS